MISVAILCTAKFAASIPISLSDTLITTTYLESLQKRVFDIDPLLWKIISYKIITWNVQK